MKKVLLLVALLFSFTSTAHALNTLQLGITGGTYANDTTFANGNVFHLNAYLLPDKKNGVGDTYYLSAALVGQGVAEIGATGAQLGSFKIGSSTYSVTQDMVFGTPLPAHDIFPTWYLPTAFSFDPDSFINPAINVANGDTQEENMYLKTFGIDISGLADGYGLHFDLYSLSEKNPFSHDAEAWKHPDPVVPEPGTVLLLGSGFLGLAIYGRRRKNC